MFPVYIDSDGLLVDWLGPMKQAINLPSVVCQETLNKHPNRQELIRDVYRNEPDFFDRLNPLQVGITLVEKLRKGRVPFKVLTAIGSDHHDHDVVRMSKVYNLNTLYSIPEEDIIVVSDSADKATFAHENAILIDDYERNINQWRAKGGRAYQLDGTSTPLKIDYVAYVLSQKFSNLRK